MKGLISGITTIIKTIKLLFSIIMNIFDTLALVIRYLITIVQMAITFIGTLPTWLSSFAIITIAISLGYFLIGRNIGKSD